MPLSRRTYQASALTPTEVAQVGGGLADLGDGEVCIGGVVFRIVTDPATGETRLVLTGEICG